MTCGLGWKWQYVGHSSLCLCCAQWEEDAKRAPASSAGSRTQPDTATVFLENSPANPQSQTSSWGTLCGEEWLEDVAGGVAIHTNPVVSDCDKNTFSSSRPLSSECGSNQEPPRLISKHRVDGICDDAPENLLHL